MEGQAHAGEQNLERGAMEEVNHGAEVGLDREAEPDCGSKEDLSQGSDPQKQKSMAVQNLFVQKFFGYANQLLQQLSAWLVSDDLGGEDAGCGGPGLVWLHVVCGCEAG